MSDLYTLGETMALLSAPEVGRLRDMRALRLSIAGSESNVAIGMSRLGHSASWMGRVGADELGQLILGTLRREQVDVSAVVVDERAPTALMLKERRTSDVVRVSYYRSRSAGSGLSCEDLDEEQLSESKIVHVTGVTLGVSKSANMAVRRTVDVARAAGCTVSFDFNYRSALWTREEAAEELRDIARRADIVFASEEELTLRSDPGQWRTEAKRLAGEGCREVVVKRGAQGAVSLTAEGIYEEAARVVHAVDPVGAGDAFVAGYLAGLLDGLGAKERLEQGCATGACAVTVLGDWEGAPYRDELALLRRGAGIVVR